MLDEQVELLTLDHDAASAVGHEGSSNPILQKYFFGSKSE